MTLVEALLSGLVLALAFWVLAGLYEGQLDQARTRQAEVLLAALDEALAAYHAASGAYPPGGPTGSMDDALAAMLQVPVSAEVLARLDLRLWHLRHGRGECLDPWGHRPRYLTAHVGDPELRARVARCGGRPVCVLAGPDGRFGRISDIASADDLGTDEPGLKAPGASLRSDPSPP